MINILIMILLILLIIKLENPETTMTTTAQTCSRATYIGTANPQTYIIGHDNTNTSQTLIHHNHYYNIHITIPTQPT